MYNEFSTVFRQNRLNNLILPKSNISEFNYINMWHEMCTGLKFKLTPEIASFAYDLAIWKEPYVCDKSDYPKRTWYERVFHIWVGCLSECIMYLYLQNLGINLKELDYYDVVRISPEYNSSQEYDLKVLSEKMSLKITPCGYYFGENNIICIPDTYIKGTPHSSDRYYCQFIFPFDMAIECKCDCNYNKIIEYNEGNINDLSIWFLGGLLNKNGKVWGYKERIKITKDMDAYNYMRSIFSYLSKPFTSLI